MNHHVAQIDYDPVGGGFTFNAQRQHTGGAGFLHHMVGDGHYVARGGAGANNHAIGDAGFAMYINGDDVLTFQVINFVDNKIWSALPCKCSPWVREE